MIEVGEGCGGRGQLHVPGAWRLQSTARSPTRGSGLGAAVEKLALRTSYTRRRTGGRSRTNELAFH